MKHINHYTTVPAFFNIIREKSIRMTKSDFLNDPMDCNLLVSLIERFFEKNQTTVDIIINEQAHKTDIKKLIESGSDILSYIKYIHSKVDLYVMSLTEEEDGLNMWNYYGNGGFRMRFEREKLEEGFRKTLAKDKQFITASKVIYIDNNDCIESIEIRGFSDYKLMNKGSSDLFKEHKSYINSKSGISTDTLYNLSTLSDFLKVYINNYIISLNYLLANKKIEKNSNSETVMKALFENEKQLDRHFFWKHDLSLYLLVLSALIKSDTYQHEKEFRIVYFEYSLEETREIEEQYATKSVNNIDIIYPFIELNANEAMRDSFESVKLSPFSCNIPINNNAYIASVSRCLASQDYKGVDVHLSNHRIRW